MYHNLTVNNFEVTLCAPYVIIILFMFRESLVADGWYPTDNVPSATTIGRIFQILHNDVIRSHKSIEITPNLKGKNII